MAAVKSGAEAEIARLARRHSTATVLYHHAMAEHLGLGPSDHKCLDLLAQRPGITGSRLAAMTGLTTGAVTGVVNRLEQHGFVRREADPADGRRQLLQPVPERMTEVAAAFASYGPSTAELLAGMGAREVAAVRTFLARAADQLEQRATLLRAEALKPVPWEENR